MTSTNYLKSGTRYDTTSKEDLNLHESLPVGTYTIKKDPRTGEFFIQEVSGFTLPPVIYGDAPKMADKIFNTFSDRPKGTGVLLAGEKGSGKTLLAEILSKRAEDEGMPTIIINDALFGEQFNSFVASIDQPAVIIFDEFEKVYNRGEYQEALLTLLDGVYPSKKLYILTVNDVHRINDHMNNRPGRLYYSISFKGLSEAEIVAYCEQNLKDKEQIPAVVRVANTFLQFNFDLLKALVEEMNRYDETPTEAMKYLNANPAHGNAEKFDISFRINGEEREISGTTFFGSPFEGLDIYYKGDAAGSVGTRASGGDDDVDLFSTALSVPSPSDDEDGDEWNEYSFTSEDIVSVKDKRFVFRNKEDGVEAILTQSAKSPYSTWLS